MIPRLIKLMRLPMGNKAFSLIEMMVAVGFSVLLLTGVYGFFNASSQFYSTGISAQALQDGANILISRIIEGQKDPGGAIRLSTSSTFTVPDGTVGAFTNSMYSCGGAPQALPCNLNPKNIYSELYFCQDNPALTNCNFNDPTARWFYVNSTASAVLYHYPGIASDEVIYQAPPNTTIILRFSPPSLGVPANPSKTVVEVDAAVISADLAGGIVTNQRLNTSGSATTFVLLRDHP